MNTPSYPSNSASMSPTNSSSGVGSATPATPSTTASPSAAAPSTAKPATGSQTKEDKTDVLKEKLEGTLKELKGSWRSLSRLKDQIRSHPLATILSSAAVLLAIGTSITVGVLESQRRRTFSYRFNRGLRNAKRKLLSPIR